MTANNRIGFQLLEVNPANAVTYSVKDNISVERVSIGILCSNLNGGVGSTVRIEHNRILNKPGVGGAGFDVSITNCNGVFVFDNKLKACRGRWEYKQFWNLY